MPNLMDQYTIHPREGFSNRWAADRLTLLDIAIRNGSGIAELIDETTGAFPEIQVIGSRTINGTTFPQRVRSKLPKVGFRHANEGAVRGKGEYINRVFNCHIFNPRWEADKAVADSSQDGAQAVIADEAAGILESAWQHLGQQFYYGLGHDDKGCAGLIAIYDNSRFEMDVSGGTANQRSSVWGLRLNRSQVQWLIGNNGNLGVGPLRLESVLDDNGQPFTAYVQEMLSHIGLKVSDIRSIGRISKLTKDSGKGLTDNVVAEFVNKFPTGQGPTHLFMNKTQREELRKSRITDLLISPPIPTESQGIPIVVTDSIVDGHALEQ